MSEALVRSAAEVLAKRVGWHVEPALRSRLQRCLHDAAAARGTTVPALLTALEHDPEALADIIDRVTVQETAFFRDPAQFEGLATEVLPGLPARPRTLWSAGCANGQEAYSAAMLLLEADRAHDRVLATDIARPALARTRAAEYTDRELRGLSELRRSSYLEAAGPGRWRVRRVVRDLVDVRAHSLTTQPPPVAAGSCRVVLCRNVLIYLRREDTVALLDRLAGWMHPEALLLVGYSESLWHVTDRFALRGLGRAFAYQPVPADGARRAAARPSAPVGPAARSPREPAGTGPGQAATARTPLPDVTGLLAEGERAAAAGDHAAAATAFRRAAYLDPDHPIAHLHLGVALESAGARHAALRAYAAARGALARRPAAAVEAALGGYAVSELAILLDAKLERGR